MIMLLLMLTLVVEYVCACSAVSDSLQPHGLQPPSLLCQWDFPWQKYWSGLPFPSPGDLPDPGIKPTSPVSPALAGRFFTTEPPGSLLLMRTLLQIYIKFNIWKAIHFYWLTYSKFTHNLNKTFQSLLYNLWSKYRLQAFGNILVLVIQWSEKCDIYGLQNREQLFSKQGCTLITWPFRKRLHVFLLGICEDFLIVTMSTKIHDL